MNIVIIDDHTLFAEGLSIIISNRLPGADVRYFNSIESFECSTVVFSELDLLISDIELPGEDVFPFLEKYSYIPILVISMHNKLNVINHCLKLGIKGYILKDDHDKVIKAINEVISGRTFFSPKVKKKLAISDKKDNILTPKEEAVIKLIAQGKNNKQIAEAMCISINTVKSHRKNLNAKLNAGSPADLIKYFYDNYVSHS